MQLYFENNKSLPACLLFILTFSIHSYFIVTRLGNGFLRYDDHKNFVTNPLISGEFTVKTWLFDIWTDKSVILGVYEPISQCIKLGIIGLFGNTRYAHLLFSNFLNSISISFLYVIVVTMLEKHIFMPNHSGMDKLKTKKSPTMITTHVWVHFHVFLLYGLSSKRVEVLSWASCNGYTNALFFMSLGIYFYTAKKSYSAIYFLIFYVMAVLSKAVALPFILFPLVHDFILEHKLNIKGVMLMLYVITTIFLTHLIVQANKSLTLQPSNTTKSLYDLNMLQRGYMASKFYLYDSYLSSSTLCVHYFISQNITSTTNLTSNCFLSPTYTVLSSLCVVLLWVVGYVSQLLKQFLLYLIMVVAALSPVVLMSALNMHGAENGGIVHIRYMHLSEALITYPFLSFFIVKVLLSTRVNDSESNTAKTNSKIKSTSILKKGLLSIFFLITIAFIRNLGTEYKKWKNTNILWNDALKKNSDDYYAHHGLAENLVQMCGGVEINKNSRNCKVKTLKKAIYHMQKSMKLKVTKNSIYNMGIMHGMLMDKCSIMKSKKCIKKYINGTIYSLRNGSKLEALLDSMVSRFTEDGESKQSDFEFLENVFNTLHTAAANAAEIQKQKEMNKDVVYYAFGKFYHLNKHYTKAFTQYARSIEINNENAKVYANQGEAMRRMGTVESKYIYASYQRALELDPKNLDALYGLAALKFKDKEYYESVKYCKQIYNIDNNDISALFLYANAMAEIDTDASILLFEEIKTKGIDKVLIAKVNKKIEEVVQRQEENGI